MTDRIKRLSKTARIYVSTLLTVLTGLSAVAAGNSSTNQVDGIDSAPAVTTAAQRDPFWPVGYAPKWKLDQKTEVKGGTVRKEGSINWNVAMEQVAIQGVSSRSGNEFFAVINGLIKSAGETVTIEVEGVSYTWMIESISPPSSVKLRRVSAE